MKIPFIASVLLATASAAYGQTSVQTIPGDAGPIRWDTLGRQVMGAGNLSSLGLPPVLSACGSGSPVIVGSNLAGTITMGNASTGCVATFSVAYINAPTCIVVPASGILAAFSYTTTTTALTITQTSTSGNTVMYACIGKQ